MTNQHISVLYHELLDAVLPENGHLYIDGTLGAGGHSSGLLERNPKARLLAFDWDNNAIQFCKERMGTAAERITFINDSYANIAKHAHQHGFDQVDGIMMDLGLSSRQLDDPERGFSFRYDAPLDMRFDQKQAITAAELVNHWPAEALADIFWRYADERQSRKIAAKIVTNRPIQTTKELATLIESVIRQPRRKRKTHPATKVFQALRIAVNGELDALEKGLKDAIHLLKPGGRIAIISFHSLEDRIVKHLFRRLSDPYFEQPMHVMHVDRSHIILKRITRKPIVPTDAEISTNPRSRSAKLRVAEKLPLTSDRPAELNR